MKGPDCVAMILRLPICSSSDSVLRKRACSWGKAQSRVSNVRTSNARSALASAAEGKGVRDNIVDPVKLIGGNAVRRQQIDGIAERPKQNIAFQVKGLQLRPKSGEVAAVGHFQ